MINVDRIAVLRMHKVEHRTLLGTRTCPVTELYNLEIGGGCRHVLRVTYLAHRISATALLILTILYSTAAMQSVLTNTFYKQTLRT